MASRVAVITDALSDAFFFPVWHRYYGRLFGEQNLYVVTYRGLGEQFRAHRLGGVWEVPLAYDDGVRPRLISSLVLTLMQTHNMVVRVDVDEFLVPDLRKAPDLAVFLENMQSPYVTARGFDVIHLIDEPKLNWSRPILIDQRAYAYANASLNKTCATSIPLDWSAGFHGCTARPVIDDLFMLHLKWADAPRLLDWFGHMSGQIEANPGLEAYYRPEPGRIEQHRKQMSSKPVDEGWKGLFREEFCAKFISQLHFDRHGATWEPKHEVEPVILRLPMELRGLL